MANRSIAYEGVHAAACTDSRNGTSELCHPLEIEEALKPIKEKYAP